MSTRLLEEGTADTTISAAATSHKAVFDFGKAGAFELVPQHLYGLDLGPGIGAGASVETPGAVCL